MTMLPTTPEAAATALSTWRMLHGLSQQALANELGVAWNTVHRWEAGTRAIPPFLYLALREIERQLDDEEEAS